MCLSSARAKDCESYDVPKFCQIRSATLVTSLTAALVALSKKSTAKLDATFEDVSMILILMTMTVIAIMKV
jgi:hypothetical protein